jgi:ABC-type multidrug transport system fused ATPase/permease subunit
MIMKTKNALLNQIQLIILYLNNLYQNIKIIVFLFIFFTLPSLIIKIRIIYFLIIIILSILVEISNLSLFNDLFFPFDFSILNSNDVNNGITNDSAGSNLTNGSSTNSDPNLPNSPNPMGNESALIINGNSNHDNTSNSVSNMHINGNDSSFDFIDEEEDVQNSNNLIAPISDSDDAVRFNEIEYDPQFDDLEFNPCILYHVDHPFFERMVYQQIANNNVLELVEFITSSTNPEWDIDSKYDAINIIEEIVY